MSDFEKKLKEYREEIDEVLIKKLEEIKSKNPIPNLYDAVLYHMKTGGKRLRPILALLVAESYGVKEKFVLPLATAVEILHNFSLVHDDIEDGDKVRRGKPTVWAEYGLHHGVNVGDAMRELGFKFLSEGREMWGEKVYGDLTELAFDCLLKMTEGQAKDMNFRNIDRVKEEDYMDMVIKKTGYMIKLATVGAAIVANQPYDVLKAWEKYSFLIGPGFQIRDDVLDFTKGKGRGEIGCDVKEGKRSLLVVYIINNQKVPEEEKLNLIEILNKPRDKTTEEDVLWVYNLFKRYQAFEYAIKKCKSFGEEAKEIIRKYVPSCEAKDLLLYLTDFLILREY